MEITRKINKDLYYIGCSDRKMINFESVYPTFNGMSYNSYLLIDDKTILFDTVDKSCHSQFYENIENILENKSLDYFIINHLEPDHSALAQEIIKKYPNVKIVCNQKSKDMLYQFFEFKNDIENNFLIVKEGDILETKNHKFTFIMAPMVHWPEVMVTYDITDKILFSADAFGSFGALDGNIFDDEININEKISEYRRYYTNIVGKYGPQVNNLLNKASKIDIQAICPLHGYILKEQSSISKLTNLYSKWANYEPEIKSALVLYASIYGATQNAADFISNELAQNGIKKIKSYDISQIHQSYILSDAFKYSHIIIATPTYNNEIFTKMEHVLSDFVKHNLQNRTFAIIENGSWAPNVTKNIICFIEKMKNTKLIENIVTIKSSLKSSQKESLIELSKIIYKDITNNN